MLSDIIVSNWNFPSSCPERFLPALRSGEVELAGLCLVVPLERRHAVGVLRNPGGSHVTRLKTDSAASLGQTFRPVLLVFLLPEREEAPAPLLLVPPLLPAVLLGQSRTEEIPEI